MTDTPIQKEFMKLISRNYGIITAVLHTYIDMDDMPDVQQNILLRAWKGYANFKGDSKFSTWLHKVAVNVAVDHLRSKRLSAKRKLVDIPETEDSYGEWWEVFEKAFQWLTDMEQELLSLYIHTSLSGPKTAKILKMPTASVYYKLNKIKEGIRRTYPK